MDLVSKIELLLRWNQGWKLTLSGGERRFEHVAGLSIPVYHTIYDYSCKLAPTVGEKAYWKGDSFDLSRGQKKLANRCIAYVSEKATVDAIIDAAAPPLQKWILEKVMLAPPAAKEKKRAKSR